MFGKWLLAFLACCVITCPPVSVFLHNAVLLPWVFPYSALRTQELVSGAQVALVLTEACKLRLFDHLDVRRAALLGGHQSHIDLSTYETFLTVLYTGSWTTECRTVRDIASSISPALEGDRKLRAVFRLLNSVAATGLISSTVITRERSQWSEDPSESGCFFNTNAASLFLTSIDAGDQTEPIENTASMCGMGIISNHISVLSRLSNLANVLLSDESESSITTSSFVKPLKGDVDGGTDLWEDFAKHSGSFQSQVAKRVSTKISSRAVSRNDKQSRHHTTVVDIGGGSGVFLTDMLMSLRSRSTPQQTVSGVLFDLPGVIDELNECKSSYRCVGGSIFDEKSLETLSVGVREQSTSDVPQDVIVMFNSFLQHFDDALSARIVDSVILKLLREQTRNSIGRIRVSLVELVSPGSSSRTSPYVSPSPIHLFNLLYADLSSPECSLAEINKCYTSLWEYVALDSLTTMGRMFSTVISSLTSSKGVDGGEVRSNAFYSRLLGELAQRLDGVVLCDTPYQNILFPLPASLSQVECHVK